MLHSTLALALAGMLLSIDSSTSQGVHVKLSRRYFVTELAFSVIVGCQKAPVVNPEPPRRVPDAVQLIRAPTATKIIPAKLSPRAMTFLEDGRLLVAENEHATIFSMDESRATEGPFIIAGIGANAAVVKPSFAGRWIFACDPSGAFRLIDPSTGNAKWKGRVTGKARPTVLSEDKLIVLDDREIHSIDCTAGKTDRYGKPTPQTSKLVRGGEWTAYTETGSKEVHAISEDGRTQTFQFEVPPSQFAISPNGLWLAIVHNGFLQMYDMRTGKQVWIGNEHLDSWILNNPIQWSGDGRRGWIESFGGAYVWSMDAPQWVAWFTAAPEFRSTTGFAISPDGQMLAAHASDGVQGIIAIWPSLDVAVRPLLRKNE